MPARTMAKTFRGVWSMKDPTGQVPPQVPHWMHERIRSPSGKAATRSRSPASPSASYRTSFFNGTSSLLPLPFRGGLTGHHLAEDVLREGIDGARVEGERRRRGLRPDRED